ncbi:glutathione S-transferase family protein [Actibacterium sp. XHP0104]|uniref:glutathione S-transferase family protein n=1 Tax=Actibacterium sp. XHP0104 TaxID=2984335 RepID=UPI0021E7DD1C|nr:glutathione S-transferase N-terminal domain-containing protein [Actibacterium sp. XHP0104]MCV2882855.1 glutathione S-transferase N-terminal domain-containing protein [Actibacterium sp. XHP0104]
MTSLNDFPITRQWPPRTPGAIQYYGRTTPNGVKISIALEELGLPYDAHHIRFEENEQHSAPYMSLNPNAKIPAIIDPNGPDGEPLALFESGAILIYLAEKTGRLIPTGPQGRYQTMQWLMFQMGGIGPMFGQVGFFLTGGGKTWNEPLARARYLTETARLLKVLDTRLADRDWVMDDYSIADIAIGPWVKWIVQNYNAGDLVGWADLHHVPAYLDRFLARPAVQRGLAIPPRN